MTAMGIAALLAAGLLGQSALAFWDQLRPVAKEERPLGADRKLVMTFRARQADAGSPSLAAEADALAACVSAAATKVQGSLVAYRLGPEGPVEYSSRVPPELRPCLDRAVGARGGFGVELYSRPARAVGGLGSSGVGRPDGG